MTDVYVALYVEPGDHHRLIGTFGSWDSLTSRLSTDYGTWMQGGGLIPTGRTADGTPTGDPVQWVAGDHGSHIEVTLTTLHATSQPATDSETTYFVQVHLPDWDMWNDLTHEEPGFDDDPPRHPIGDTFEAVTDAIARVRANRPEQTFRIVERKQTVITE